MQTQRPQTKTTTTTFVVYHLINGVFLSEVMGLAFWSNCSNLDSATAWGFESEVKALNLIVRLQEWNLEHHDPAGNLFSVVPVPTVEPGLATREECAAAGLPTWDVGTEPRRYRYQLQGKQGYVIHTSEVALSYEELQVIAAQL